MRVDLIIFIRNNKVIHHLFILRISLDLVTRGQHSKCEMSTFPNFGMFKMYSAIKGFADPFADGKSETYSVCVHLGSVLKFAKYLEKLALIVIRDANTCVRDSSFNFFGILVIIKSCLYFPLVSKLDSILEQVHEDLLHSLDINDQLARGVW